MSPAPANVGRTYLLVPMHVDALAVGQLPRGSRWSNFAPHFGDLQNSYATGFDLRLNELFRNTIAQPPKAGIHLHFKLPAALTHGAGSGELAFPRIPNRWLVQRFETDSGRLSRAWLVRSDKADPNGNAVSLPVFASAASPYDAPLTVRPTGARSTIFDGTRVLATVREDEGLSELELTAVTGGDAAFSAHYPACRSILGLHDDELAGVSPGTKLSYLVTGWYSSLADDPWHQLVERLNKITDATEATTELERWLNDHRCARSFADVRQLPSGLLCHGVVAGVAWDPRRDYSGALAFDAFGNAANYSLDVGNTTAEAIASLVAGKSRQQELLEDVLTALQTGLMSPGTDRDVGEHIDVAHIDDALHRHGFAGVGGGVAWALRPVESGVPDATEQHAQAAPRHVQALVEELNARQAVCNRHAAIEADLRRELHAVWHRWTKALMDDGPADVLRANLDALRTFVAGFNDRRDVAAARSARDAAKKAVIDALKRDAEQGPEEYTLGTAAAAPFYVPADPVFLLRGPAMKPLGTRMADGAVRCRVSGDEVTAYIYDEPNGAGGMERTADACVQDRFPSDYLDAIPTAVRRLVGEALLLDEVKRLDPARRRLATDRPFGSATQPDDIALFAWQQNPWLPLYLAWELEWRSDYDPAALADTVIAARWTLDDGASSPAAPYVTRSDLTPRPSVSAPPADDLPTYTGFSLLQPVTSRTRSDAGGKPTVASLLAQTLATQVRNSERPMMAHAAGGFHDALLMRRVGDQLPPLDYRRFADTGQLFRDRIAEDLGATAFDSAPASDLPFLPVRSGALRLRQLLIVDAFGQTVWLKTPPEPTHAVRLAAGDGGGDGFIPLRPRFSQPMRLSFTTAPGGNEPHIAPESSPICGWVVPNHLEQSLTLYAANGVPLAVLQRRFDQEVGSAERAFYWVDVPGGVRLFAASASPEASIANTHLRDFARYVLSLDAVQGAAFARLVDESISATPQRVPEEDPGVSILVGRPLALVRAALRFETPGLPALDQKASWLAGDRIAERLAAAVAANDVQASDGLLKTAGAERVRCPVRLGDRRTANDGLVGFFVGDPASEARPFYASWGFRLGNVRYPHVLETQDEMPGSGPDAVGVDGASPLLVTLLMDPQARVNATTGVLPRAELELRGVEAAGAKLAREVFFQTAPVLGASGAPQVPTPSDDYGEWSWAYRPSVTQWADDPAMIAATDRAGFSVPYPTISEGWLKLKIAPVRVLSFWLRNGNGKPAKGTDVSLAWSVYGADEVRVEQVRGETDRSLVAEWRDAPLGREVRTRVDGPAIYELIATDRSGNEDRKRLTIEVADT